MKLYDVTSWTRADRKKLEKNFQFGVFAEGATYKHDYIITFSSELEMYKKMLEGIKDDYNKPINIQYKKVLKNATNNQKKPVKKEKPVKKVERPMELTPVMAV